MIPTYSPTLEPSSTAKPISGTSDPTYTPTLFPTLSPSFAPTLEPPERAELWAWGARQSIGDDGNGDLLIPADLSERIIGASAGLNYTLVILANRSAAVAGFVDNLVDYAGHFGIPISSQLNSLRAIPSVETSDGNVVKAPRFSKVVAGVDDDEPTGTGKMHSIFIDVKGNAYATGWNNKGQLCLGNRNSRDRQSSFIPTQIVIPNDEEVVDASVGAEFTLLVTSVGNVYGCGANEVGQIGLGNVFNADTPILVEGLKGVTSISSGLDFSFVKAEEGLYTMGSNDVGE